MRIEKKTNRKVSMFVGSLVAPAIAALAACLLDLSSNGRWYYNVLIFVGSYGFAIVVGLPTVALLCSKKLTEFWHFVCWFFVIGTLIFGGLQFVVATTIPGLILDGIVIVRDHRMTESGWQSLIFNALMLGSLSAFGGGIFWGISIQERRNV